MSVLVFTDLDGSLMEHETYSIDPARPALESLRQRDIPVIINSSKTAKEIQAVQSLLQLDSSFICENGAALYSPETEDVVEFGQQRKFWLPEVHLLREQNNYRFSGFYDWSPAEISTLTGLSQKQAIDARDRHYSEPILWKDSVNARTRFEEELKAMNLGLLEGGRFLSIQPAFDKSNGMQWMIDQYQKKSMNSPVMSVALGDSPNDTAMLDAADIAVIIKSSKSNKIELSRAGKIIRTSRPGPAGWQDAVDELIELYDKNQLIKIEQTDES